LGSSLYRRDGGLIIENLVNVTQWRAAEPEHRDIEARTAELALCNSHRWFPRVPSLSLTAIEQDNLYA
jgi:hypothetical protein